MKLDLWREVLGLFLLSSLVLSRDLKNTAGEEAPVS